METITDICSLSVVSAQDAIANGDLCPVTYVDALLDRIGHCDERINAFITVSGDEARKRARLLRDSRKSREDVPPLFGIPYAVKDNIDVRGLPTTCQSPVMPLLPASKNADVVDRLEAAGAICLGKLTMDEFALGDVPSDSSWPRARNPLNVAFTPGSSSSGSAAAVAAGFVPFSLGTDTGGSIRSPAAMTGTIGLKPTHSSVSMKGIFPLAQRLDAAGPIVRSLEDIAAVMTVLDPNWNAARPSASGAKRTVGHIRHFWETDLEPALEVQESLDRLMMQLGEVGTAVRNITLPPLQIFDEVGWCILHYDAYRIHHQELERRPELYGEPTRALLACGAAISEKAYRQALDQAEDLRARVDRALTGCDVLVTSVSAMPPCRIDDSAALIQLAKSSTRMPFNVTGHPALSVPIGQSREGLPIACQWICGHGAERTMCDFDNKENILAGMVKSTTAL